MPVEEMLHRRKSYFCIWLFFDYYLVIRFFGLLVARVLEDDRSILPREVGRKKRFYGATRALLRRTVLVAGLRKGAHPSIAACRRLTYEALVTPRFCAVDSNSTRRGRNRRGFKKKKSERSGGGRARVQERERERKRGRGRQRMAEQSGKTGITIDCKSLDKRPGIVKTRSSILILYVASQGWAE